MMSSSSSRSRTRPAVLWRFSRNSFILSILAEFEKTSIKYGTYIIYIRIYQYIPYIHRYPSMTSISQTTKGVFHRQNPSIFFCHDADPSREGTPTTPSRLPPWNSKNGGIDTPSPPEDLLKETNRHPGLAEVSLKQV